MAQQRDGRRPSDTRQTDAAPTVYRRVENPAFSAVSGGLTREQRQARARRKQALLAQKRRRRRRLLLAVLMIVIIAVGFVVIKKLNGSFGVNTDGAMDDLDIGDLDDEAEDNLYTGPEVATIAFVGEISVSADQVRAATRLDNTYDFETPFADVRDYFSSDSVAYAVGSLETTIVNDLPYGTEPYYNAPVQLAGGLRRIGFRLMSTATTSALNNGVNGVTSTLDYLAASKLRAVGTYASQEDRDRDGGAYIRKIHHIKFAFLSYTKGTDSVTMPEGCEYALNTLYTDYADYWSDLRASQIRSDVQAAKDAGAEVIVALVHWGSEYNRAVSDGQREVAQLMMENGVDVIIGCHSHLVSQMGFETVQRNDGSQKQCFVAYGLGDFYTDPEDPRGQQSMILNLEFSRGEDGAVTITGANYIPTYLYVYEEDGIRKFAVLDVYRNLAELKRQEMTSQRAELLNALLDTIDTMHNYGGVEMDVGPADQDRRIVQKAIDEGEISALEIQDMKRAESDAAARAAREEAERRAQEAEAQAEESGEDAPEPTGGG